MTHLTPDELIDAMAEDADLGTTEGMLASDRQAHLAGCEACRRQLADLAGVLGEAKQAGMPEPSPMFWPYFSQRVSAAIGGDAGSGNGWPGWLRWQGLVPLGAVAAIILALVLSVPRVPAPVAPVATDAPIAPDALASSDSWETVADLVGHLDVATASAAGVIEPGVSEQAVLELTADEQLELTRLLKEELTRAKS